MIFYWPDSNCAVISDYIDFIIIVT